MSTSTTRGRAEEAFKAWLDTNENPNRARLGTHKSADYVLIFTSADAKPQSHVVDRLEWLKWSNSRPHVIANCNSIDGKL